MIIGFKIVFPKIINKPNFIFKTMEKFRRRTTKISDTN